MGSAVGSAENDRVCTDTPNEGLIKTTLGIGGGIGGGAPSVPGSHTPAGEEGRIGAGV